MVVQAASAVGGNPDNVALIAMALGAAGAANLDRWQYQLDQAVSFLGWAEKWIDLEHADLKQILITMHRAAPDPENASVLRLPSPLGRALRLNHRQHRIPGCSGGLARYRDHQCGWLSRLPPLFR